MIYLDYQSTTPTDPRVLELMLPYFTEKYGNPHSNEHSFGWEADAVIEKARQQISSIINAKNSKEIIFTSGGTESNNLALKGVLNSNTNKKKHIVTCVTEHSSVLEVCKALEKNDVEITFLPVNKKGIIDLDLLEKSITNNTVIVSIMSVNNEIGVIQPLKEIGKICHKKNVLFHTDASQAIGKIPIDVIDMSIDLLTISGHKFYAPKGIGAIYIRDKNPKIRLTPLLNGGGQEKGIRAGTLPTPLCVGLGEACHIAEKEMYKESEKLLFMRNNFIEKLFKNLDNFYINGDLENRISGNLNISFKNIDGANFILNLKELNISTGASCLSKHNKKSHVLSSIGIEKNLINSTIRIGFGRFTTEEEMQKAADLIIAFASNEGSK